VLLEKEVAGEEVNIRDLSGDRTLVRFGTGDEVTVTAGEKGVRFLLISGAPLQEPVAWHGPIVMNTQEELPRRCAICATAPSSGRRIDTNGHWE
jgi:redox-sensitive bicupin YhaK (pirin superfamily)